MKKFCVLLAAVVSLSVFVGCSGHVGLSGKVTYSDDDSPLTVGNVVFKKGGLVSWGKLQSDGTYVIGSVSEADGLPPGVYQVYVSGAERVVVPGNEDRGIPDEMESLIDLKYTTAETSELTVEVKRSTKFDFQVDRYVAPQRRK